MRQRCLKIAGDFAGSGAADVESLLTDFAVDGEVAQSTQEQAFYSLLFFCEHVLKRDLGTINGSRARKVKRIPTIMRPAVVLHKEVVGSSYQPLPIGRDHRMADLAALSRKRHSNGTRATSFAA